MNEDISNIQLKLWILSQWVDTMEIEKKNAYKMLQTANQPVFVSGFRVQIE